MIAITRRIAAAAARDAANRRMRAEGRTAFNEDDLDVAAATQLRLLRHGGLLDENDEPTPLYFEE